MTRRAARSGGDRRTNDDDQDPAAHARRLPDRPARVECARSADRLGYLVMTPTTTLPTTAPTTRTRTDQKATLGVLDGANTRPIRNSSPPGGTRRRLRAASPRPTVRSRARRRRAPRFRWSDPPRRLAASSANRAASDSERSRVPRSRSVEAVVPSIHRAQILVERARRMPDRPSRVETRIGSSGRGAGS